MATVGKAIRPIFIPQKEGPGVKEVMVEFSWFLGMSAAVRKRSIQSLHEQARELGFHNILEASSKSEHPIGIPLSAFFLCNAHGTPVENLFQMSKVFKYGGPYLDLLNVSPREAKRDPRLKTSGPLVEFRFNKKTFPLEPKTLFYDWLYCGVLFKGSKNEILKNKLLSYNFDAYSDIEFNPSKSFSCQARTLALGVSIYNNGMMDEFIADPVEFSRNFNLYTGDARGQQSLF